MDQPTKNTHISTQTWIHFSQNGCVDYNTHLPKVHVSERLHDQQYARNNQPRNTTRIPQTCTPVLTSRLCVLGFARRDKIVVNLSDVFLLLQSRVSPLRSD